MQGSMHGPSGSNSALHGVPPWKSFPAQLFPFGDACLVVLVHACLHLDVLALNLHTDVLCEYLLGHPRCSDVMPTHLCVALDLSRDISGALE